MLVWASRWGLPWEAAAPRPMGSPAEEVPGNSEAPPNPRGCGLADRRLQKMLTKGTGVGETLCPVCSGITSSEPLRDLDLSPAQVVTPLPL